MSGFVAAAHAGISAIPVDTVTKRAMRRWKEFQVEIAELLVLQEWDRANHNIAFVCGQVSGRLLCLDFEVGFMGRLAELSGRLGEAGLYEVFESWIDGYCESTPSGGMHVLVRLEGEGPCPRNEVFAADKDGKPLVETRGEGGYVIVAPSRNGVAGWELMSGAVDTVTFCTLEEWVGVQAVLASFAVQPAPPSPTVATRSTVAFDPILSNGERWVDEAVAALGDIRIPLTANGWQFPGSHDSYGEHCTRPGKDPRHGTSASISHNNRLYVHTSSSGMHVGNPTYDVLDVILFYQLGRDPTQGERVGWLKAQRPPAVRDAGASPTVDDGAADSSVHLEDWFWEATPLLGRIRQASVERGLSPDGVCGAWVSGYAATVPMGIWVAGPPARAPLNMFSVLVGSSGTGKTGSMRVASDLLGWNVNTNPHVLLGRGLRSGEGLCRLAQIPARKGDDGPPAYRNAIQVAFDEGGTLGKQADRSGSTMIPYLNTAWSGHGTVGGALAREVFEFPADLVRVCAVLGVQFGAAGNLFEGESATLGFPQRLIYFGLRHPDLRGADVDVQTGEPAEALDTPFLAHADYVGQQAIHLKFPADIEHNIRLWTRNKDHGDGLDDILDAHRMNLTKRMAAVFTLAHRRETPDHQMWDLAEHVIDTSGKIRRQLIASLGEVTIQHRRTRIAEAVETADALDNRWLRRRASRIARHIHTSETPLVLKDIRKHLASDEKRRINEILDYATASDWIIHKDNRWLPGGSRPA